MQSSECCTTPQPFNAAISSLETATQFTSVADPSLLAPTLGATNAKCFFCGNLILPHSKCSARDSICHKCQKKGLFVKVCRGKPAKIDEASAALWTPTLTTVGTLEALKKSTATVLVSSDWRFKALGLS